MKRTDSRQTMRPIDMRPLHEAVVLCLVLISLAFVTHAPAIVQPAAHTMTPADLLLRQPELGGSAEYVPVNRLLIDPVLQFEPWEGWIASEAAAGQFAWWNPLSGTGAPLAANGQSRMFDPLAWAFRSMPGGYVAARESALRFVLCGLGTWLLTLRLGCGPWVRAWAVFTVPLTGFFTLWRLYPLASAATALPWLWAASSKLGAAPSARACASLALAVAWSLVAGNVQIAAVGFCGSAALWLIMPGAIPKPGWRHRAKGLSFQAAAFMCGLTLAAPAWMGVLDYVGRSPIWADRLAEHSGSGRGARARWADLPCLVFPFVFGSERRGDTNVAKAAGATNVNEAAAGHVGLIAAAVLVPLAIGQGRQGGSGARWALALAVSGLWIGYRLPPVSSAWHRLPVFQGVDPRRFVPLATFGSVILAGFGLERIAAGRVGPRFDKLAPWFWAVIAAGCVVVAGLPLLVHDKLEAQARRHYEASVPQGAEHDRIVAVRVADQIAGLTHAWPKYMAGRGFWLLAITGIWAGTRRWPVRRAWAIGLAGVLELATFGWGYNPQIQADDLARRLDMRVIDTLKTMDATARGQGHVARFLAVGECLPPNQLMRFGLRDLRNYDSIELLATLEGLEALFEPAPGADRSSRRAITWAGVHRAERVLRDMGVIGVVGLSRPDSGLFDKILEPIPGVFVGVWPSLPKVEGPAELTGEGGGWMKLRLPRTGRASGRQRGETVLRIRESFDPGWRVAGESARGVRLVPEGRTGMLRCVITPELEGIEIMLTYRPAWFDRSILPAVLAAAACLAGLAVPSGAFGKKGRNSLFTSTDAGVESNSLRCIPGLESVPAQGELTSHGSLFLRPLRQKPES